MKKVLINISRNLILYIWEIFDAYDELYEKVQSEKSMTRD